MSEFGRPTLIKFLGLGKALIPINQDSKIPMVKNWSEKKPELSDINISGNWGVVLDDTDLVVDYDPRNVKDSDATQEVFDTFRYSSTLVVKTGGGGYHYYFKKPPNFKISKTLKNYPGFDFLSKGSYVMGPESIHPSTKELYEIVLDDDVALAPDALLNLVRYNAPEPTHTLKNLQEDDSEANINQAIRFLQSYPGAVQGSNGDDNTYFAACRLRDYGIPPAIALSLLYEYYNPKCIPEWSHEELIFKVNNAFNYALGGLGVLSVQNRLGEIPQLDDFLNEYVPPDEPNGVSGQVNTLPAVAWYVNGEGVMPRNLTNTVNFFLDPTSKLYSLVKYDEFKGKILFNKPAPWHYAYKHGSWADDDTTQCKYFLSRFENYDVTRDRVEEAVLTTAKYNKYNPCTDWFESLKDKWDGKPRLDTWLSEYGGAEDNELNRAMGRKTLLAAVTRAFNPGCKFDYVLVLEGPQGIGKSTAIRILAGPELYSAIDMNADKDTVDAIQGSLIVEIDEMGCLDKVQSSKLKGFLSRTEDNVRLAYHRHSQVYPRKCIFIGSVNPQKGIGYLRDKTGNRRFWTVEVKGFNFSRMQADREQLWAEAYHLFLANTEKLYLDDQNLQRTHAAIVSLRLGEDPWISLVVDHLKMVSSNFQQTDEIFITTNDIVKNLSTGGDILNKMTSNSKQRIDSIMSEVLSYGIVKSEHNNNTYKIQ